METLARWGWIPFFESQLDPKRDQGLIVGRAVHELRGVFSVQTGEGEVRAGVAGRLHQGGAVPVVAGDWVGLQAKEDRFVIQKVFARRSQIVRQAASRRTEAQVLAANVDVVFVVTSFEQDLSLRRIERYVAQVWESGASPVVVLNKADLSREVEAMVRKVEAVAPGVPVFAVSALDGSGVEALLVPLGQGRTGALLGSSGVGKSSLLNRLSRFANQEVRAVRSLDQTGQHTTTSRHLFDLGEGRGLLLDTPGMREFQVWTDGPGLERAFEDVQTLAVGCKFRNCTHSGEPGCQVQAALDEGRLDEGRLGGWRQLQREADYHQMRRDEAGKRAEAKRFTREVRAHLKAKGVR
jgi:ribosome biogenesis GTPase